MLKIYVNDNPHKGACDVADHFVAHWLENDKLHPKAKEAECLVNRLAEVDSIVVTYNDEVIITQNDNNALRLDILQGSILAYLKALK